MANTIYVAAVTGTSNHQDKVNRLVCYVGEWMHSKLWTP